MTNKIVAVQGNNPSKLNPVTDTSVFLAHEIQNKNYKIFYYDPKDLSIINSSLWLSRRIGAHLYQRTLIIEDLMIKTFLSK